MSVKFAVQMILSEPLLLFFTIRKDNPKLVFMRFTLNLKCIWGVGCLIFRAQELGSIPTSAVLCQYTRRFNLLHGTA